MAARRTRVTYILEQDTTVDSIDLKSGTYYGFKKVISVPQYGGAQQLPPEFELELSFDDQANGRSPMAGTINATEEVNSGQISYR